MSFYPPKINEKFRQPKNVGKAADANAAGTGASFTCGAFVRFHLRIEPETREIIAAKFKSNGCGFMIAAADVLADKIVGKTLLELHGSDREVLRAEIKDALEDFPARRVHCLEVSLDALQTAFADFRLFQIEEFAGEKPLICTCFGVSEDVIENVIKDNSLETVEEVGAVCSAGTGCGSCQFLIQELIDVYWSES